MQKKSHILAQTNKINFVHEAKIQDPACVLRHGQQSVFIRWLPWLLQMVPLLRWINLSCQDRVNKLYYICNIFSLLYTLTCTKAMVLSGISNMAPDMW